MKITDIAPLLKDPDVVLLDVRDPGEVQSMGSVKGAIHIPMAQLEKRLGELPKNKRILTA